jgi:hypothetical protein
MAHADLGLVARIPIGDRYLYLCQYSAAALDTSGDVTVKADKIDAFYLEGMTKYSVSGKTYTVTYTDPDATVTRNYFYIGR